MRLAHCNDDGVGGACAYALRVRAPGERRHVRLRRGCVALEGAGRGYPNIYDDPPRDADHLEVCFGVETHSPVPHPFGLVQPHRPAACPKYRFSVLVPRQTPAIGAMIPHEWTPITSASDESYGMGLSDCRDGAVFCVNGARYPPPKRPNDHEEA